MANTIKHKRGTTVPTAGQLIVGELAINTTTGGVYTKTDAGGVVAVGIEGAVSWGSINGTLSNQTDLGTALGLKADLASPTFTGDPKAPTPATSDNDTSIATTAYVKGQGYLTSATAASTYYLQTNPSGFITSAALSSYLPLAGGTLTGNLVLDDPVIGFPATLNGALFGFAGGLAINIEEAHIDGFNINLPASGTITSCGSITFQDLTVQTTATLVGPTGLAGTNGVNGTVWNYRGAYDNGVTYAANDYVDLDGSSYVMINTVGGGGYGPISHPATWQLVAHKGDTGATGSNGSNGADGADGDNGADGGSFADVGWDSVPYIRYNQSWQPLSNYDQTGGGGQVYSDNILTNLLSVSYSTYYISTADSNRIVTLNGACTIYLGTDCPVGTQLVFIQQTNDNTTFYGHNGATLYANGSKYRSNGLYAVCTAIKTDTYTWYLAGDIIV